MHLCGGYEKSIKIDGRVLEYFCNWPIVIGIHKSYLDVSLIPMNNGPIRKQLTSHSNEWNKREKTTLVNIIQVVPLRVQTAIVFAAVPVANFFYSSFVK